MKPLSLLVFAAIAVFGLFGWLDRRGDRAAFAEAERHLLDGSEVRRVFGAGATVRQTAGSVAAGQVLNWSGELRGNGMKAKAAVGMNRKPGADRWTATRAKFQLPGEEWRNAYAPIYAAGPPERTPAALAIKAAWDYVAQAIANTPAQYVNPPTLRSDLRHYAEDIARKAGIDAALQFADSTSRVVNELGGVYAGAGALVVASRPADAVARMQRYIAANAPNSQAWLGLAEMQSLAGNRAEAIAAATRALEIDPGNARAFLQRGLAHLLLRDSATAFRDFEQACAFGNQSGCAMKARTQKFPL